jgi:hypothetical protein
MNTFFTKPTPEEQQKKEPAKSEENKDNKTATEDFEVIEVQQNLTEENNLQKEFELITGSTKTSPVLKPINPEPKSLLEYTFSFIDTDEELNPVLSGYFFKLVVTLFKRNPPAVRTIENKILNS